MRCAVLFAIVTAFFSSTASADFRAGFPIPTPKDQMIAYKLAECIVQSDALRARQVVSTLPGSKENENANRGLVATVETCWNSAANGNLNIGTSLLRGAIAEALYHKSLADAGVSNANPYAVRKKD